MHIPVLQKVLKLLASIYLALNLRNVMSLVLGSFILYPLQHTSHKLEGAITSGSIPMNNSTYVIHVSCNFVQVIRWNLYLSKNGMSVCNGRFTCTPFSNSLNYYWYMHNFPMLLCFHVWLTTESSMAYEFKIQCP